MSTFMSGIHAASLHVMTWNIRRRIPWGGGRRTDRWTVRKPRLQSLLVREQPALFAAQEVLPDQEQAILQALGETHRVIGFGRGKHGTGERCPVFYDDSLLELLDWRQEALSETPERLGSTSWGNPFPRIALHADFRDRRTGTRFHLINTHLDPLSARSRHRSASVLRHAASASPHPCLVTGDFNAGPDSDTLREFLRDGTLVDAWHDTKAHLSPEYATYANYRPARTGTRIDWILTSAGIRTARIGINSTAVDGGWGSDHLPVQAELVLPGAGGSQPDRPDQGGLRPARPEAGGSRPARPEPGTPPSESEDA